jgi:hypothetical protein
MDFRWLRYTCGSCGIPWKVAAMAVFPHRWSWCIEPTMRLKST